MDTHLQDRRIRKTKRAIHEAMMELLEEKTLSQISIMELTKRADVNRKTFYNHYADIYAVIDEIEDEIIDRLIEMLKETLMDPATGQIMTFEQIRSNIREIVSSFFNTMITNFENNHEYFKVLENCDGHSTILKKLVHREKEILINIMDTSKLNAQWIEYFLIFMVDGAISVINTWSQEENPISREELTQFFTLLFTAESVHDYMTIPG